MINELPIRTKSQTNVIVTEEDIKIKAKPPTMKAIPAAKK